MMTRRSSIRRTGVTSNCGGRPASGLDDVLARRPKCLMPSRTPRFDPRAQRCVAEAHVLAAADIPAIAGGREATSRRDSPAPRLWSGSTTRPAVPGEVVASAEGPGVAAPGDWLVRKGAGYAWLMPS